MASGEDMVGGVLEDASCSSARAEVDMVDGGRCRSCASGCSRWAEELESERKLGLRQEQVARCEMGKEEKGDGKSRGFM